MEYKHQKLQDTIKRNLMISPLAYKRSEIWALKQGDEIIVSMMSEEDQKRRGSQPIQARATPAEWQALFEENPRLAQHLADAFISIN